MLCVILSGCASMSRADRAAFREIQGLGLDTEAGALKSPTLAACLDIGPGIGNFYLASGTDQTGQWVYGILNLLFWPISVIWAVPEGAIDANTINKMETIYYYRFDPQGKQQFEEAKLRANVHKPPL